MYHVRKCDINTTTTNVLPFKHLLTLFFSKNSNTIEKNCTFRINKTSKNIVEACFKCENHAC